MSLPTPLEITSFFSRLQNLNERHTGALDFASALGVEKVLIFGKDTEVGVFLPALGFAQTLNSSKAWHAFLRILAEHGEHHANLPFEAGKETPVYGITDHERLCAFVFVGNYPDNHSLVWIKALLPLLGGKLVIERIAQAATGHAEAARQATQKAAELNAALSINRHELRESIERIEKELVQRREAESKLQAADQSKNEFLAMLAHELRNPLAPISTTAGLLKLVRADDPRIVMMSDVLTRQVGHMTNLIDDLLDVSRVTRGAITLDIKRVDLKHVISEAVEQVKALIELRHHRLTVKLPLELVCMRGDLTRLVQIVSNLLSNAAKYTPEGGALSIEMKKHESQILIKVRDNGVGIDKEFLPRVFDLFSQSARSPDRAQGGLGIGLALVKRLVELHGGSIHARSDPAERGSEFAVIFPISNDVGELGVLD